MATLATTLSSSTMSSLRPRLLKPPPTFSASLFTLNPFLLSRNLTISTRKRMGNGTCRAGLENDAPFAAAIGACILSSLVLPVDGGRADDDSDAVLNSTDARLAVMGIISFIPFFNWLSWVFAWLDSGKRRYALYALVYLAPYLRSNFSLSPEESWLPIGSIVFCIIHIQLEASIRNGDLQGFQIFERSMLSSWTKKGENSDEPEGSSEKGRRRGGKNLPSAEEQSRNEMRRWGLPKKPLDDKKHSEGGGDWD